MTVVATRYTDWYGGKRRQNWETPPDFFAKLHAKYRFTLDGASEPGNGLLPRSQTEATPLGTSWAGERVFCNPPWSVIAPFVELAAGADFAVLLVPARTNAGWFHRALELGARVDYFRGRIRFIHPETRMPGIGTPIDCVLLIFEEKAITDGSRAEEASK